MPPKSPKGATDQTQQSAARQTQTELSPDYDKVVNMRHTPLNVTHFGIDGSHLSMTIHAMTLNTAYFV